MDDIIMFSKIVEEHIHQLDDIINTVKKAGVTLNLKKCPLFSNSIDYLGHVIKTRRLEIDQSHKKVS